MSLLIYIGKPNIPWEEHQATTDMTKKIGSNKPSLTNNITKHFFSIAAEYLQLDPFFDGKVMQPQNLTDHQSGNGSCWRCRDTHESSHNFSP